MTIRQKAYNLIDALPDESVATLVKFSNIKYFENNMKKTFFYKKGFL